MRWHEVQENSCLHLQNSQRLKAPAIVSRSKPEVVSVADSQKCSCQQQMPKAAAFSQDPPDNVPFRFNDNRWEHKQLCQSTRLGDNSTRKRRRRTSNLPCSLVSSWLSPMATIAAVVSGSRAGHEKTHTRSRAASCCWVYLSTLQLALLQLCANESWSSRDDGSSSRFS